MENRENTYNLALGTIYDKGVDFESTTNNGDRNKILATVARTVYLFFEKYPDKIIYLTGSDHRRNLLYQRAIAYAYDELTIIYEIYGSTSKEGEETNFEPFDKTQPYSAFVIKKR